MFVLVNRWYHMALQGCEILPAYNSLRATTYISRFPLLLARKTARKGETRRRHRGWINRRVARTSWGVCMSYMRCVYRGGSRDGGPDGVWCKEGVAFRRVWVLWGAYGDACLKSISPPPLFRHTSRTTFLRNTARSHGRGRIAFIAT